jgi:hypothetical protein
MTRRTTHRRKAAAGKHKVATKKHKAVHDTRVGKKKSVERTVNAPKTW